MINLPQGVNLIQPLFQPGEKYYLVGGAVRDALLGRASQDIDILCDGDTRGIARKLADRVGGSFFMLDEQRNTCRVILNGNRERIVFDFAQMRGSSLLDDLQERDFTFNAMAVDLADPVDVRDPMKGGSDLVEKRLRPCKETSFADDPLRVIRAIRYSVMLDLHIEAPTSQLMKQTAGKLGSISEERKRDELFKILDGERAAVGLELLAHFGILPYVGLKDLPDFQRSNARLRSYSNLSSYWLGTLQPGSADHFLLSSFVAGLKPYRQQVKEHLAKVNQSDRSRNGLNGLAALLWDLDPVRCEGIADELALSRDEEEHLSCLLTNRQKFHQLLSKSSVDRRNIYHYYQPLAGHGIDLCLLSMVEQASVLSSEFKEDRWISAIELCAKLLDAWFNQPESVNPKLLLTGRDLMFEFDLIPGPLIGKLLDGLREEQAAAVIQTRSEALEWVESQLHPNMLKS